MGWVRGNGTTLASTGANPSVFAHNHNADANLILAFILQADAGDFGSSPTVTYDAVGMTRVAGGSFAGTSGTQFFGVMIYELFTTNSGPHNVSITFGGAVRRAARVLSYKKILSRRGAGTTNGNSTAPSRAQTSIPGDLVVDIAGQGAEANIYPAWTVGASQTELVNNLQTTSADNRQDSSASASDELATGTSTTMSWTLGAARKWGISTAAYQPQPGGNQVIWAAIERAKNFARDLKYGLIPADELLDRYGDLMTI